MKRALLFCVAGLAISWSVPARADLIVNGGFEDGVFSSTIDGHTNPSVPVGWTPSAGFVTFGALFNSVGDFNPRSGLHELNIANNPGDPLAMLSQSFSTVAGATYVASFYISNVPLAGFFKALIDDREQVTVVGSFDVPSFTSTFADGTSVVTTPATINEYTLQTFTFVGTGSDTLTFAAVNGSRSYRVDDVSVTAAPEPAGFGFMLMAAAAGLACRRLGSTRRPCTTPGH